MRQRGQASVESIALLAAVLALASALVFGVARLGPPLASVVAQAVEGAFGSGRPAAPSLDALELGLLAGATGAGADGPTLLDLRTHLRSRLDRAVADAAFDANVRREIAPVLEARGIELDPSSIDVSDRAVEDAWVRHRFQPGIAYRLADAAVSLASWPGTVYSLLEEIGVAGPADSVPAGRQAGDLEVWVGTMGRLLILRRMPETGLTIVSDALVRIHAWGSK